MEKSKKNLKTYAVVFIIYVVCDVLELIISAISGDFNIGTVEGVDSAVLSAAIAVVIIFSAVMILVNLFLGIQGIRQAKGLPVGKAHITVATVALVFSILALCADALSLTSQADAGSIASFFLTMTNVVFIFLYRKEAKALL